MLRDEDCFPIAELPSRLPRRRGKKIAHSTAWRWAMKGVRGVRLETRRLGGTLYTSMEALERFSRTLAETDHKGNPRPTRSPKRPTARARKREIERAWRTLEEAGI